jgi:hypothetical protein
MSIEIGDPVVFPSVIGLEFEDAEKVAYAAGVVLADFDPDAPPIGATVWPLPYIVTAQEPGPGVAGRAWGSLRIRVERLTI